MNGLYIGGNTMALKANSVNWFEIPTKDLSRAKTFYEYIFDVQLTPQEMGPSKMAWFPMEPNAAGASGSLHKTEGFSPNEQGTVVYFTVDDIENVLKKVNEKGGKTLQGKESIGEYGFIAQFQDCEGNRIGLHSAK
jgi:predicted enzyme related to lactoylglutathione lyase